MLQIKVIDRTINAPLWEQLSSLGDKFAKIGESKVSSSLQLRWHRIIKFMLKIMIATLSIFTANEKIIPKSKSVRRKTSLPHHAALII